MEKTVKKNVHKKLFPPIWQPDYHVLNKIRSSLAYFLKKYLAKKAVIVDYRCGEKPYKLLLRPYLKKYIGVDISPNVEPDIPIREDEPLLIKTSSVDLVVSTQVLESTLSPIYYLSECNRILKNKGLLFISTHGIWYDYESDEEYYRWTRKGLIKDLLNTNFQVLETVSILGPFSAVLQLKILLIQEYLVKMGIMGKFMMSIISIVGNLYIYLLDKIFPPTSAGSSSVYFICAQKNK